MSASELDPFHILGVSYGADDDAVRKAYLAAVRENPPDGNAERFGAIIEAYERIKTEEARARYHLTLTRNSFPSPVSALVEWARWDTKRLNPMSREDMQAFLKQVAAR